MSTINKGSNPIHSSEISISKSYLFGAEPLENAEDKNLFKHRLRNSVAEIIINCGILNLAKYVMSDMLNDDYKQYAYQPQNTNFTVAWGVEGLMNK